jgi:hypothetical protein
MDITTDHLNHVEHLIKVASGKIRYKYIKGVLEHGGNLWEHSMMELLNQSIDETVDNLVYLLTLRDVMKAKMEEKCL